MSAELHSLDAAKEERRIGRDFHNRVQGAMDALGHWRRLIVIAMSYEDITEVELDNLHCEMTECGKLIRRMARSAKLMADVREGAPWE